MNNGTHLVINLKRKIRDINNEKQLLMAEIDNLRRNIRISKMGELEVEIKQYIEECARLRHQLEEVIKSKDTFADPQELKVIEAKFQQKDVLIKQMQAERAAISAEFSKKDEENR
jgi:cell shape-determining protein MreC